jgi:hypothetical protein
MIVPTHVLVIENQSLDLAIIYAKAPNRNTLARLCPVHPHSQPPFKWSPVYLPQRAPLCEVASIL